MKIEFLIEEYTKKNNRIQWVDVAKGMAILLMVVGHEINYMPYVYPLIFSFHMPLFFILSGYTSRPVEDVATLKIKVIKTFKQLYPLAVLMVILFSIESWIVNQQTVYILIKSIIKGLIFGSNNPVHGIGNVDVMWFLYAFCYGKAMFDLVMVLVKDNRWRGVIVVILSGSGMLISTKIWLPQALDVAMVVPLFMFAGQLLRKYANQINQFMNWKWYGVLIIIWLVLVCSQVTIDISIRHYPDYFVSVIEALCGSFIVIKGCQVSC